MDNAVDVTKLRAERAKAKEAVATFERALTNRDRTSRELGSALAGLRDARDKVEAHWPVLRGWTLLLAHPGAASEGEIYDMIMAARFFLPNQSPMEQLQLHLATVVWPGLSRFIGNLSFDGVEARWLDAWLQLREQVPYDARREDRLEDCDALLELIARLFGMSSGETVPASAGWVGALHEQAASYARLERCLDDPQLPLVTPSSNLADRPLAYAFVGSLAAVYSAALANPGLPGAAIASLLARTPAFLRARTGDLQARDGADSDGPRSGDRRAEWIELLLGYWAADDAVVEALLSRRGIIKLKDRVRSETRPLTWVDGHEQRIALIGPSGAGKTSLMMGSDALRQVTIYHALGESHDKEVEELREIWRKGELSNTEHELFMARTGIRNLCSFTFIDVNGESYFPQDADKLPNLEVIKLRYARRPPTVVMLMLNGNRPLEMVVGKKLDETIGAIRDSPVKAGGDSTAAVGRGYLGADDHFEPAALNHSRPIYLLVSHADEMIGRVLADRDDELVGGLEPHKGAVEELEAKLSAKVLRLEDLHLDPQISDRAAARAVLKCDRELLKSPAALRVILDAIDIFWGAAQAFAAAGLDNIHLHFLRSGGGTPPKTTGVESLWKHLWLVTSPASRVARKSALERRLSIRLEQELREADGSVVTLDGIELLRPTRAKFQADATQIGLASIRRAVIKKFKEPGLSLDKLLSDSGGPSIFSGRFKGQLQRIMEEYDNSLAMLDERIGAAVKSILELNGIPVSKTFGAFSSERLLIKQEENLKQLEKWRRQYLTAVSHSTPSDVADAERLLQKLPGENSEGRALLQRLLDEYRSLDLDSGDAARSGSMFHALRGALNDTCMWRNLPIRLPEGAKDDWSVAEKWLAENPALTISEALNIYFNKLQKDEKDDEKRDSDWNERILPAIRLLSGFRPMLPTLHVDLLETDHAKVRSVEVALARFEVSKRGVEALNDIRGLAVIVRGGIPMGARLRALVTLAALEPLLKSLNIDAEKLAHKSAVQSFRMAQDKLDEADSLWRSRSFFSFIKPNPKLHSDINKAITDAKNLLADYGANGGQPVGGEASRSREATKRAKRIIDFALWLASDIQQSPFEVGLGKPCEDIGDIFGSQIENVQKAVEKCKMSLKRFYDAMHGALLQERYHYLLEAGLLTNENAIAANLGAIFTEDPDPGNELPVQSKQERYKQAVTTLLSRLEAT